MSKWTDLVTKVYKKNHAKNSTYKFKDALKDAAKIYKSSGKTKKAGRSRKSRQEGGHIIFDPSAPNSTLTHYR